MPEIAKSASTPKRFQHVSPFAFFEAGFIGWIVRVGIAFYLDVSLDGSALGVEKPEFVWSSLLNSVSSLVPTSCMNPRFTSQNGTARAFTITEVEIEIVTQRKGDSS